MLMGTGFSRVSKLLETVRNFKMVTVDMRKLFSAKCFICDQTSLFLSSARFIAFKNQNIPRAIKTKEYCFRDITVSNLLILKSLVNHEK